MTTRIFNFGAGPAVHPEPVLEEVQRDLMALPGVGMSVLEISHRSRAFTEIIESAEANIRSLIGLPDDYRVLFVAGGSDHTVRHGAHEHPARDWLGRLRPHWDMGRRRPRRKASLFGDVRVAATTESEAFSRIPRASEIDLAPDAAYVHIASNNTIVGTRWPVMPESGDVPLVVDASSDVFSRPLDLAADGTALLYAGAQKNLGPAGVALVIVRDDLVQRASTVGRVVPTMLRYATYAKSKSLHNTPPVFAIYVIELVTKWLIASGGLTAMAERNERKAQKLYDAIDRGDFYRGTAFAREPLVDERHDSSTEPRARRGVRRGRRRCGIDRAQRTPVGGRRASVDLQRVSGGRNRRARGVHVGVRTGSRLTMLVHLSRGGHQC